MKPLTPLPPPVTAQQISQGWIDTVAAVARAKGHALRAGEFWRPAVGAETKFAAFVFVDPLTIEVQSINEPKHWGRLMLEHSGFTFATAKDRDEVLTRIQRRAARE